MLTLKLNFKNKTLFIYAFLTYSISFASTSSYVTPMVPHTTNPTPTMMDSGYYNFDGTGNSWVGTVTTNRLCPTNYSPYFVFIPDITWNPDGGNAFLITERSITTNTSNYSVSFNKQYGQDSGGIAFTWVMFCYPPGMSTPSYLPYGGSF